MIINPLFNIIISVVLTSQINGLPVSTVCITFYIFVFQKLDNVLFLFLLRPMYIDKNHTRIVSTNYI